MFVENKVRVIKILLKILDPFALLESDWMHAIKHTRDKIKKKIDLILTPHITSPTRMYKNFDN